MYTEQDVSALKAQQKALINTAGHIHTERDILSYNK